MPKDYASVNVDVWGDPDFRRLPAPAQHLYLLLWTSPGLSYCGVHDWRPGRIATLADGLTADTVKTLADCLEARHFVITDTETEEILIRSWVRFDGLMRKPRMAISCITAYGEVASNNLRGVIVHELQKVRGLEPDLASWGDPRVQKVLEHPTVNPKTCPSPTDPFADGFAYRFEDGFAHGFAASLPQTRLGVCTPPTPAPAPAPYTTNTLSCASAAAERERESDEAEGQQPPPPELEPKPKRPRTTTTTPDRFDEFWDLYPRKRGSGQAMKAYRAAIKKTTPDKILDAIRTQYDLLTRKGVEFCPYPATWLNGERWNDEVDKPDNPWAHLEENENPWNHLQTEAE